jgi:hypothetical protein
LRVKTLISGKSDDRSSYLKLAWEAVVSPPVGPGDSPACSCEDAMVPTISIEESDDSEGQRVDGESPTFEGCVKFD